MTATGGGVANCGRVVIPELEEAAKNYHRRTWTADEEAIMRSYYGRVSNKKLLEFLPGRTVDTIRQKADRMMLSKE